jgi:hypothetical protein
MTATQKLISNGVPEQSRKMFQGKFRIKNTLNKHPSQRINEESDQVRTNRSQQNGLRPGKPRQKILLRHPAS